VDKRFLKNAVYKITYSSDEEVLHGYPIRWVDRADSKTEADIKVTAAKMMNSNRKIKVEMVRGKK
jgi:hypothetical protein